MSNNLYNKNSIESISPLEFTRLEPGVYAGDTTFSTQLLIEILSNAVDEYRIGHGNLIGIHIDGDVVSVKDNGQGFIYAFREDGKSILEASFSVLNTSGKYREDGVYEKRSLGSFGIGSKVTTFLSNWLKVVTWRDGKTEQVTFKEGVFDTREYADYPKKDSGTCVTWKPSKEFFTHTEVDINVVKNLLQATVCLCPGLKIELTEKTELGHNKTIYKSSNGLHDLVDKATKDKELLKNRLSISRENNKDKLDLVMTYTSNYSSTIIPYVNTGLTDAGPHIVQIKTALTREMNKFFREKKWLKEKDENLTGDDIQEGMYMIFNIITSEVDYDAQVKTRVSKMDVKPFVKMFTESLCDWLTRNEKEIKVIADKAINAKKARDAARKAKEAIRNKVPKEKKSVLKFSSKLADCWSKDRKKCEIFIVEGDSAGGNAKIAKNNEFQAVLPVRGKILNIEKAKLEKILGNTEIIDMINAFGLELDAKTGAVRVVEERLRYGKIIVSADADLDGGHICLLFYTFIWNFAPELIEKGYIYTTVPPLYKVIINKDKYIYLRDDAALEDFRNKNKGKKYTVSRYKGLGEMDVEELEESLLNKDTRVLKQITVKDVEEANRLFEDLMGPKVEPRKEYIEKYGNIAKVEI